VWDEDAIWEVEAWEGVPWETDDWDFWDQSGYVDEMTGAIGDISIGPHLISPLGMPYAWGQALGWWGQRQPSDVLPHVSDIPQYLPHGISESAQQAAKNVEETTKAMQEAAHKFRDMPSDIAARAQAFADKAKEEAEQTIKTIAIVGGIALIGTIVLVAAAKS